VQELLKARGEGGGELQSWPQREGEVARKKQRLSLDTPKHKKLQPPETPRGIAMALTRGFADSREKRGWGGGQRSAQDLTRQSEEKFRTQSGKKAGDIQLWPSKRKSQLTLPCGKKEKGTGPDIDVCNHWREKLRGKTASKKGKLTSKLLRRV